MCSASTFGDPRLDYAESSLSARIVLLYAEELYRHYVDGELYQAEFVHEGLNGIYARLSRDSEAEMVK